ncbi:hypothetical protein AQUCO_04500091v1 [Aquilegia coerulea]|uniref:Phosphoinositide phospholipase C n=1 Tax=Aquilegia coerulea TaxID=218851 RepID=A0A2G5CM39_AQUCA|nr:hypothetical protein AQUCO_04500091v1 [Aquilegia coerulea]
MTAEQLLRFLIEFQGETSATIHDAEHIIQQVIHRKHHAMFNRHGLTPEDFHHFLFSDDLNSPISNQVHQDMTAPMSHYFIFTGHNSYLTGNQLSSDCSDAPIIKALVRGVRVIELDIWPNFTRDNVHVVHGRTLTTPVSLIKCLKAIKQYAFSSSPYPVVITLEDHLSPDLQAKVAEMVTQIFGEMLFYPEKECLEEFPSPEEMKYRIILSTKPPKEYLETNNPKEKDKDSSEEDAWGKEMQDPKDETSSDSDLNDHVQDDEDINYSARNSSQLGGPDFKRLSAINVRKNIDGIQDDEDVNESSPIPCKLVAPDYKRLIAINVRKSKGRIQDDEDIKERSHISCHVKVPDYKRLIAIHVRKSKGGLIESLKGDPASVRRLSLSEPKLLKAREEHGTALVRFTQRNILRVYPRGSRVNSSNYNPLVGWMHGAQMVAFNMQGHGRSLWLMQGMFRSNGGCGYVKKPDILLDSDSVFDPKVKLPVKKTLRVRVYMGDGWRTDFNKTHFDAYSPPDFYARVGIAGVPADTTMQKTEIMDDDWVPVWDKDFYFPLTVPELALLRIEVHEYDMSEKDDFGGQTCLPVWELRPGIRAVPLFNRKGEKFKSVKLLIQFQFV